MKIWFDTEFMEDGKTIELLSIGMIREDGLTYYAESIEANRSRANDWVKANVLPHMLDWKTLRSREGIKRDIEAFAGEAPEFWAYYGAYDWVALAQLFGTMMDLPSGWPMFARDLKQLAGDRPLLGQTSTSHNALNDAIWTKLAWEALQ